MILLVVDTQKGIMDERLYEFDTVRRNIAHLLSEARKNGVEVVFVRHDDGPGTGFSQGDEDFEIFAEFAPQPGEKIFDKTVNSAFHPMTGLSAYLAQKGEKTVMIVGLQTDFCIDATIKSGFVQGYRVIVPAYANSTFDNPYFSKETAYRYYNEWMWKNRYAETVTVEEAAALLQSHAESKSHA